MRRPWLPPLPDVLQRLLPWSGPSGAERFLQRTSNFYIALDDQGVVTAWNDAASALFGWPPEQALGRRLDDLIVPPSSHAAHLAGIDHFRRTGHGRGLGGPVEVEALRADGTSVPVELSIWAERTGRGFLFHALGRDLTARRRHQRVLEVLAGHRQGLLHSEEPQAARQLLCDTVRESVQCQGVYLYEPGPQGLAGTLRLTAQSLHLAPPAAEQVTVSAEFAERLSVPGPGMRLVREQLDDSDAGQALRALGLGTFVLKPLYREERPVGALLLGWFAADRAAAPGEQQLIELLASEALLVFERLTAQEELRRAVRTDWLTGLANRRSFDEALHEAVGQGPLSLVVLDLDRFKGYNDEHGHPAGDALLVQVATAWRGRLLDGAHLARIGGDEFALLLPGADLAQAQATAAALAEATPAPVGVTTGEAELAAGEDGVGLLRRADAVLYARKRAR